MVIVHRLVLARQEPVYYTLLLYQGLRLLGLYLHIMMMRRIQADLHHQQADLHRRQQILYRI